MGATLYKTQGIARYSIIDADYYKLSVDIDPDISKYYRALIPRSIKPNPQKYTPHVSVVRKEVPPNINFWNKYEGKEIELYYENIVHFGEVYCWLNVFSKPLEDIRLELGLPVSSQYTLPPEGFIKCFHTTIGNYK